MKKIFLYGPPGAGKTTIGKYLATTLDLPFIDVDTAIESAAGMPIPQIMAERGESAFREMESVIIDEVCKKKKASSKAVNYGVIALGGGALLHKENRSRCESVGDVIILDADLSILYARLSKSESKRPLLAGNLESKLRNLIEQRENHYNSFKYHVTNNTDINSSTVSIPDQVIWDIQQELGRYRVQGMGQGYDVIIESECLEKVGLHLRDCGLNGPIMVVSDENVAPLYAKRVEKSIMDAGLCVRTVVIPAGEEYKTLKTVVSLWSRFLNAGLDRNSTVIALGGGVVSDLAGFAASTFMRGCRWMVIPTTLLSMVDASLGGKTGFDLPEGKNLVGSFYPPSLVMSDPNVLSTLPEAELRSGLAEVVKHGVIADPELIEMCAIGFEYVKASLPKIVRRAIGVKARIIGQDPFEKGIRAALNFGHTVGHAVEIASKFHLRHGEAVSIGMVVEAKLAEKLTLASAGLANRIAAVLTGLGLPTDIPLNLHKVSIVEYIKFDKKKSNNVVRFALPVEIGKVITEVEVTDLQMIFKEQL